MALLVDKVLEEGSQGFNDDNKKLQHSQLGIVIYLLWLVLFIWT